MKADTQATEVSSQKMRLKQSTAPSLRVPVTPGNRVFLRCLRAAELSAWEAADRKPYRQVRSQTPIFSVRPCAA